MSLTERNVAWNSSAERSELFDFATEDAASDRALNKVSWKALRGENAAVPAPRRGVFLELEPRHDKDDD